MAQNQEQIEARLAAYIDGELDATERAEIEKHLANNPQHKQLIDELMGQRDFIKALPREAPPEIAETIHSQLERSVLLGKAGEDTEAAALRINRWPHRGAIAAIVLLTAGLGFLVYKVLPSNKPPAEFAVAPRELSPATAPLTEDVKAEKPIEVASGSKELEKALPAPVAATPTPAPAPAPSVTPEPAPAPSVALAPALAPAPSPAPAPERMSKTGDAADIAAATPPAATPPPNPSAAPPISIGVDTLPGTVPPAGAPTTPTADAGNKEDQGKIAAPMPNGLAMKNGAVFNDAAAGNQPLANAMKSGEDVRKGGEANTVGGLGGGGGGAGFAGQQRQFGAALAASNGSITLVVSTDDPSLAGEQVKAYCSDNGIAWEPTPAPASIAYAQQDYTRMNRLRSQQVVVSSGQPMAKGMADDKYRYATKDVQGNRRTEMQSLDRGGALSDESNAKKEPATQPSLADADAVAKQSAPNSSIGATTQPVTGAEQAQTRDDVATEHMAYFCRSVTSQQAHELEGVLSARPGQVAQVLPQSLAVDRTLDLNVQAGAMPTTAPSTQPAAGPIALNEQPAAPSDGSTMKDQLAVPADKLGNANGNGNFDLKQGPAQQQQQVAQQAAPEQRVDLLVVVQREISAAATQPTQQQLESPPANAAEPVRQEPPAKSP